MNSFALNIFKDLGCLTGIFNNNTFVTPVSCKISTKANTFIKTVKKQHQIIAKNHCILSCWLTRAIKARIFLKHIHQLYKYLRIG
jgi:hypothetical protein